MTKSNYYDNFKRDMTNAEFEHSMKNILLENPEFHVFMNSFLKSVNQLSEKEREQILNSFSSVTMNFCKNECTYTNNERSYSGSVPDVNETLKLLNRTMLNNKNFAFAMSDLNKKYYSLETGKPEMLKSFMSNAKVFLKVSYRIFELSLRLSQLGQQR